MLKAIRFAGASKTLRRNTKMVICNHSSNLLGSILPIGEIGDIAKSHGAVFLVDAAQSAGTLEIDVAQMNIDLLAFMVIKGCLDRRGQGGYILLQTLI